MVEKCSALYSTADDNEGLNNSQSKRGSRHAVYINFTQRPILATAAHIRLVEKKKNGSSCQTHQQSMLACLIALPLKRVPAKL